MHTQKHTLETKQKISEKLKQQRSGGLTDLTKHKISESIQRKIEMLREYYKELEKQIV